ncbi:hypothetical protein HPB49_015563 [Dermacentor silvarum]|uniref:Uncharacterized protein n=1 Tax=Dermacentor silvarum TaxID=543639 RepID=A0ACB8CXV0_DERSI|nr:hypothetical protein HPB49_015563 [Dermacentor silvarum]
MIPLPCLLWLLYFADVPVTTARPIRNDTATTLAFTEPTTLTSPTTTSYQEPLSWRQPASLADGGRNHPSLTILSFHPGCRQRVFCEAARTLTYALPMSRSWERVFRERPVPTSTYFGAWSKGMQGHDCSHLYQDCSDSPAGLVMPLLREAMGPHGLVKAFVKHMDAASMHNELMDRGAPRPSLVMEKLRQGERRLAAAEPVMPSSEFTPR